MARYVVPPMGNKPIIVKCRSCKTLYVPDGMDADKYENNVRFEACPVCGEDYNRWRDLIPLWKYNLIKWFRGGEILEQTDNSGTDDKGHNIRKRPGAGNWYTAP